VGEVNGRSWSRARLWLSQIVLAVQMSSAAVLSVFVPAATAWQQRRTLPSPCSPLEVGGTPYSNYRNGGMWVPVEAVIG
jgi:hypothetical protein